jgi:photosystem II stability/assembly factor-like uncharacterized protein
MKKLLLITIIALSINASAQWIQTSCPSGGEIQSLAISGSNIFAGTQTGGVFLSNNNGSTWTAVNTGLTNTNVFSLAVSGTNIFAGTNGGGIFLSTNNGGSWTAVNTGLTTLTVRALAVSGTSIFAGTDFGGIFLSTNNGGSWTSINNGLTNYFNRVVWTFAVDGANIYAGTSAAVFLSNDNGSTWTGLGTIPNSSDVKAVAANGANIYVGANTQGVTLSTNSGGTFTAANTGISNLYTTSFIFSGSNLIAGTINDAFITTNNANSWSSLNTSGLTVRCMAINSTNIFLGTWNDGVWLRAVNTLTGLSEINNQASNINIYPNPFTTQTTITFNTEQQNTTINITDLLGKEIKTINFTGRQLAIDKEEMKAGIYFLQTTDEQKNVTSRKIVIQ